MRVGVVHNYGLAGSGSSTYVSGLSRALRARGHDVVVISRAASEDGEQPDRPLGEPGRYVGPTQMPGDVRHYSLTCRPYLGIETHTEVASDGAFATCSDATLNRYLSITSEVVLDIARREQLEVLHVNHAVPLPFIAATVKSRLGIPYVVTLHGSHITYVLDAQPQRYRPIAKEGLAGASRVIVTTEAVQRRCQGHVELHDEAFAQIPVGVDTGAFHPGEDRDPVDLTFHRRDTGEPMDVPHAAASTLTVAFVGKVIPDKGAHLLPLIMAEAKLRHPRARLVVVGDGQTLTSLVSLARGESEVTSDDELTAAHRTPVEEYLASGGDGANWTTLAREGLADALFLGFQPPGILQAFLRRAEVCVLPSLTEEALPMTAVEAASSGTLPLTEEKSGCLELMRLVKKQVPHAHGVLEELDLPAGGSLVERYGRAIAAALEVGDDRSAKAELQGGLRDLAVAEYDWDGIAERVAAIYRQAVA